MSTFKTKTRCIKIPKRTKKPTNQDFFGYDCEHFCCESDLLKCCDKNNNTKGNNQKRKTKCQPKPSTSRISKDCMNMQFQLQGPQLPETKTICADLWPSIADLCEPLQNLCLSPKIYKACNDIPMHDRKILNCMARKRNETIVQTNNAWLANKYWENEKYERQLLKLQQEKKYKDEVSRRQEYDKLLTKIRLETISKRDQEHLDKLREEMLVKDTRLERRLKNIDRQRDHFFNRKRQEEFRKNEAFNLTHDELNLDEKVKSQEHAERLARRLSRADAIKQKNLNVYKRRIQTDNYLERALHAENYRETLKFENYKKEQLKHEIFHKDIKTQNFVERRKRNIGDLAEKARISASLRDLVRRSISPDIYKFNNKGPLLHDRPVSNLSFQSSIRLG